MPAQIKSGPVTRSPSITELQESWARLFCRNPSGRLLGQLGLLLGLTYLSLFHAILATLRAFGTQLGQSLVHLVLGSLGHDRWEIALPQQGRDLDRSVHRERLI